MLRVWHLPQNIMFSTQTQLRSIVEPFIGLKIYLVGSYYYPTVYTRMPQFYFMDEYILSAKIVEYSDEEVWLE